MQLNWLGCPEYFVKILKTSEVQVRVNKTYLCFFFLLIKLNLSSIRKIRKGICIILFQENNSLPTQLFNHFTY